MDLKLTKILDFLYSNFSSYKTNILLPSMNVFRFIVGMRTAEGILVNFDVWNETCVDAIQFSLKS